MLALQALISLCSFVCLCAVIYPFKPFPTRGKAFLSFLGLALLNGLVAVGSSKPVSATNTQVSDAGESPSEASTVQAKAAAVSPDEPNWQYRESTDEMTGVVTKSACTDSTNQLSLSFPYDGGSSGSLCFRHKGKSLNAYFLISKGQFDCGISACALKFKFDDGKIQSFSGTESSTHDTGLLFVEPERRLLELTLKAKTLKIQAPIYQEGNQVLSFNIAGLDNARF